VWAVKNNFVSVVPVQFDLTGYSALPILEKWKLNDAFSEKSKMKTKNKK
jgi:hypothetical protein